MVRLPTVPGVDEVEAGRDPELAAARGELLDDVATATLPRAVGGAGAAEKAGTAELCVFCQRKYVSAPCKSMHICEMQSNDVPVFIDISIVID